MLRYPFIALTCTKITIIHPNYARKSLSPRHHACRPYSKEASKFKVILQKLMTTKKPKILRTPVAKIALNLSLIGLAVIITMILGSPCLDDDGEVIQDEFTGGPLIKEYILRTLRELTFYMNLLRRPTKENLLPDPLNHPYVQPKYTLVLELTGVLVHPDWSYGNGWRFKKRPLLDLFLSSINEQYEIVVYTSEQGHTAFPLIEAIDTNKTIAHKLVRDATKWSNGNHIKDISNLNRPLSKIICIDWDLKSYKFNAENLFCIKKWEGNDDDTTLLDLVMFLKSIADNGVEDVREVLKVYQQSEDPVGAFRAKQKQLIDELEAREAAKREQTKRVTPRWRQRFFGRQEDYND
ncbi:mitochondrial import inner membrane translocase subunit TIM50-C-like [Anthonomus grandis grandis]|uniref:mitochondrial import inner membrane translocase subunit TIM50-C-like n=1 Tax=Anthonomus grandis grandis TaxID=2921223 RepID=UPI002165B7E5|nr:mitochondrial import inner membrane translocase subunit TIM50-C-like [Anthonomus grandis grandis]